MMVSIGIATRENISVNDIIKRSPIAALPKAKEIIGSNWQRSYAIWVGKVNGEPACIWGLIPPTILSDTAYLWLLTTDLIDDHKFLLIRHSQRWIEEALLEWPKIVGLVEPSNPRAVRWIKWLGAKFGSINEDGYLPFVITRKR